MEVEKGGVNYGRTMEVLRARTKKSLEEKTREWTRKCEGQEKRG